MLVNKKEICGNQIADDIVDFFMVAPNTEKKKFVSELFRRRNELRVGARLAFFDFLKELSKQTDEAPIISEAARAAIAELKKLKEY